MTKAHHDKNKSRKHDQSIKIETGNDFRVIRVMKNDIKKLITWQLHLIEWNKISD